MVRLIWENEQSLLDITEDFLSTLTRCMEKVLEYEDFPEDAEISLTFTDNCGIKEQNAQSRGIDKPTDVLSFPLLDINQDGELELCDEDFADGAVLLGDIVISTEKALQQAREYGHSELRELAFLTVHSMLHLLGYDHERSADEEKEMFQKQEEILSLLGITR